MQNSGNAALTVYTDVYSISRCEVKLLRVAYIGGK